MDFPKQTKNTNMEDIKSAKIDLRIIIMQIWNYRKLYLTVLPSVLVVTYLIMTLIPRTYKSDVSLAPETYNASSIISGSIGSLASSFGINNLGGAIGSDAIYSDIYPDIISSNDFLISIMSVKVKMKRTGEICDYYTYLRDKQKSAPWDKVKNWAKNLIDNQSADITKSSDEINIFCLTKTQADIFDSARGNITCVVNKKTGVISIAVKDQDPLVAATIANSTCKKLQEFIVKYRTNKALKDYEYYEKLYNDAYNKYTDSQTKYSSYSDSHNKIVLKSFQTKVEYLKDEMQMNYGMLQTLNTQKQAAHAKLQEATPAFTVIKSASVPQKPSAPKRVLVAIAMTLITMMGLTGWIVLIKKNKI